MIRRVVVGAFLAGAAVGVVVASRLDLNALGDMAMAKLDELKNREVPEGSLPMDRDHLPPDLTREVAD